MCSWRSLEILYSRSLALRLSTSCLHLEAVYCKLKGGVEYLSVYLHYYKKIIDQDRWSLVTTYELRSTTSEFEFCSSLWRFLPHLRRSSFQEVRRIYRMRLAKVHDYRPTRVLLISPAKWFPCWLPYGAQWWAVPFARKKKIHNLKLMHQFYKPHNKTN